MRMSAQEDMVEHCCNAFAAAVDCCTASAVVGPHENSGWNLNHGNCPPGKMNVREDTKTARCHIDCAAERAFEGVQVVPSAGTRYDMGVEAEVAQGVA